MNLKLPSPIEKLESPLFNEKQVAVYIKRDDLIHPEVSGNKWRKLKYAIEKFKAGRYDALLTFGGAFSNHIAATAAAGKYLSIPTIGIIRGDELQPQSNHTLSKAQADGMTLEFVSREIYAQRYERIYHEELRVKFGNILIVEEGGAGYLGVAGVAEIIAELPFEPDYIYTATGTGTTAAGLLHGTDTAIIKAVAVLKNAEFLKDEIEKMLYAVLMDEAFAKEKSLRLQLMTDFHFGGYGKFTDDLISKMKSQSTEFNIPFDQVYTAKMMQAFLSDLKSGKLKPGSKVVLLHTGGIQGILKDDRML